MTPCPISILIPAKNEADNLSACLESCRFAADVVVVDSGSTDATTTIAREFGARVVQFQWNGQFPKKKNWALETITWKSDWIFILDADERITPALAEEIRHVVLAGAHDGYYVNRRFWFMDGWLNHCGYYPSWNLRLFRHRLGRFEQFGGVSETNSGDNEVHEHVVLNGTTAYLRAEMEHHAFPTIHTWVEKHNRYSNWEARLLASPTGRNASAVAAIGTELTRKRRIKHLASYLPFRPTLRFVYHYVLRTGFLDGYRGYVFCRLMGMYEFLSLAKSKELRRAQRHL